ncbi:MAG: HDIG domain-containing protein [Nitrososphaeria archaeon]|nr:HDIG domain-containing protein [Nitrososphaeria archaeon]NIN52335.1 HDIG domain-containing protein [Nitrososphaeria archaeon]NIQ32813.1 HDIG domain-containing protein [Nitrososphaeria archaeon]
MKKRQHQGDDTGELIRILKDAGCKRNVIRHTIAVYGLATLLATRLYLRGIEVDFDLLRVGVLLHDIGRAETHTVKHGYVGAQLVRERGFNEEIACIVERHVGGGISREEAVKLGLPPRDFLPKTVEEKIVCYADKLAGPHNVISFEKALQGFKRELGADHEAIRRLKELHLEMEGLLDGERIELSYRGP